MDDDLRTTLRAELHTASTAASSVAGFASAALEVLTRMCGAHRLGLVLERAGTAQPLAAVDPDVAACDAAACHAAGSSRTSPLGRVVGRDAPEGVRVTATDGEARSQGRRPTTTQDGWSLAMAAVGFREAEVHTAPVRAGTDLTLTWYRGADDRGAHAAHAPGGATPRACLEELARSLDLHLRAEDLAATNADLRAAMDARATIDHAIGALMAVHACTAEDAMDRLRTAARSRGVKVRDLAAELVRDVTGHAPSIPAPFRDRPVSAAPTPPDDGHEGAA